MISGIPAYWSETALISSLLCLLLDDSFQVRSRFPQIFFEEKKFFIFTGIFLSGTILSYFLNQHSISGLGEIKSFYLIPTLLPVAMLLCAKTRRHIEFLAFGWFLGVAVASFAGVTIYALGLLTYDGRLLSLYLSPNHLAMLVAPGVVLGAYFASIHAGWRRGIAIISAAIIIFTLWATRSYASWVAVSGALAVLGSLSWRTRPSFSRLGLVAIVAMTVFGTVFFSERGTEKWQAFVSNDERSSFSSRLIIWRSAVKIASDSFPIGIGTGRFQEVYLAEQANFPRYLEWAVPTPHNLYLFFFLEGGPLALLGFLGSVSVIAARARHLLRASYRPLLALGLALTMLYLIYGIVDTPYMKNDLALAVWGSLGFCLAALRLKA